MFKSLSPKCLARRFLLPVLLLGCKTAVAANSLEDSFSGRWRMDTESFAGNMKPTILRLSANKFKRDDNEAAVADGKFHKVKSDGYVDEQLIEVRSEHLLKEVDRIRGKVVYTVDYSVSPDSKTLTMHVASFTSPDGEAVYSDATYQRASRVERGAHPINGEWKRIGVAVTSKSDWLLYLSGNRFSWRTEGGIGYNALIDGGPVPIDGDNSGSKAAITRPSADTIVENDFSAKGKPESSLTMQLLPDQRTIHATAVYAKGQTTTTFTLHKIEENR